MKRLKPSDEVNNISTFDILDSITCDPFLAICKDYQDDFRDSIDFSYIPDLKFVDRYLSSGTEEEVQAIRI